MQSATYNIFIHTSKYMNHLIDEVQKIPAGQIPSDVLIAAGNVYEEIQELCKTIELAEHECLGGDDCAASEYSNNSNVLSLENLSEDASSNTGDSKPKKFNIYNEFKLLLEKILTSKNPSSSYFCLPCRFTCYFESDWENHINTNLKHNSLISNPNFKNDLLTCAQCKLTIFGDLTAIDRYLTYHSFLHSGSKVEHKLFYLREGGKKRERGGKRTRRKIENLLNDNLSVSKIDASCCEKLSKDFSSTTGDAVQCAKPKTEIKSGFLEILESILTSDPYPYYFFCSVCNFTTYDESDWNNHKRDKNHYKCRSNTKLNFGTVKCKKCKLQIFGEIRVMVYYLKYHKIVHSDLNVKNKLKHIRGVGKKKGEEGRK